jgi:hypothetical protein
MNACQALTLGSIKALGHRRAEDGAVAYAMQAIACGSEIGG